MEANDSCRLLYVKELGMLICRTESEIRAWRATTGIQVWRRQLLESPPPHDFFNMTYLCRPENAEVLLFVSVGSEILAWNAQSAMEVWRRQLRSNISDIRVSEECQLLFVATVGESIAGEGELAMLEQRSDENRVEILAWTWSGSAERDWGRLQFQTALDVDYVGVNDMLAIGQTLFVGCSFLMQEEPHKEVGAVIACSTCDGQIRWQRRGGDCFPGPVWSLVGNGDVLVCGASELGLGDLQIRGLNIANGFESFHTSADGVCTTGLVVVGRTVCAGVSAVRDGGNLRDTVRSSIYAWSMQTGSPLWKRLWCIGGDVAEMISIGETGVICARGQGLIKEFCARTGVQLLCHEVDGVVCLTCMNTCDI
eukprot:gnl/MRDRNA2_/MRDRNA2_200361_c0_seq1.p1 gnl/MRDRNA2_/MRDRNA2_200361_c0~~gnl/MRDRNA2_/MRDRNA2_200361_c0_seq1.p1  ORF type:complete len:406 (+),score=40.74 gnl/MRDRNA2_/MRDRNA2_200361_c0_seq1:119-1219(+)